jgi:tetratricopeptide (TPR) repeat protein
MSKSSLQAGWRGAFFFLLLGALLATAPEAGAIAKPYVETAPKRGFHLFNRPKEKAPDAQWAHVQALDRAGRTRAAANQALALRLFWPHSPEAPEAQLLYARLMERRGHLQAAFDAYQHLMEHYTGRFEFNEVVDRQMQIAKTLMEQKKGKFLFLPGFSAPERAIPLFEKIVASAPEGSHTAEAYYLMGDANERTYEYDKAIDAYFTALNRFPGSEFAEKSSYAQAQCHIKLADDSPNDNRALDTARAACLLFLQQHPDSAHRAAIEADLARLRDRQVQNAYALALYYDRILRKPEAALIEYRSFVALFPNAEQAADARLRIEQLAPTREK